MKRFITSILMMIILSVLLSGISYAADENTRADAIDSMQKYTSTILESIYSVYQKYGASMMDEDYVELTYRYYCLYSDLNALHLKELHFNIKNNPLGATTVFGTDLENERSNQLINDFIKDEWFKYLEGETSKDEFLDFLMSMVKAYLSI